MPEPDGPRSRRLRQVLQKALEKSVAACTYDNFSQCFPTTAKHNGKLLAHLHKQVVANLEMKATVCPLSCSSPPLPPTVAGNEPSASNHAQGEFEAILRERNVIPRLNALDRLLVEAEQRRGELLAHVAVRADAGPLDRAGLVGHDIGLHRLSSRTIRVRLFRSLASIWLPQTPADGALIVTPQV